jgi:regulator of replication initiation timing
MYIRKINITPTNMDPILQLLQENHEMKIKMEELHSMLQTLTIENESLKTRIDKNRFQYKKIFLFLQQKNESLIRKKGLPSNNQE